MDTEQSSRAEPPPTVEEVLGAATPRAWVTPTITGVLVACFAGSMALGVDPFSPTAGQLLKAGASFGPLILEGQWWRIFTASLLHGGIAHLAFNLWALWSAGRLTERLYGNSAFLGIYLLSAVGAGLLSVLVKPLVVSVGASGAIFGVYGALLTFVLTHQGIIPKEVLLQQRKSLFAFLFYNLAFALTNSSIDIAGHVGGLLTGMAAGWLLRRDLQHPADGRSQRVASAAGLALLLLAGAWGVRERLLRVPAIRVDALVHRAGAAGNAGDAKRAVELCTQALAIDQDSRALAIRGLAQLRLLQPDKAAEDLRASLALDDLPRTREVLCHASAAAAGGDRARLETAATECSRAIETSDVKRPLLGERAWLRAALGKTDESLADLASILKDSPNDPAALQLRSAILLRVGKLDEAERDCAVLVAVKDPDLTPNVDCARVALRRGENRAAVERATVVLKHRPDHLPALQLRAYAHEALEEFDAAAADLDRMLSVNGHDADALNSRGWIRVRRGDFAGGKADADASLAARPHSAPALGTRCFALVGLGERAAARRDCQESVSLWPENPVDRGMLAYLDGRRAEAARLWESAGRARPDEAKMLEPWIARARGR
jgi:rhomboid protease GluP